jgi:hypothetical protein
LKEDLSHKDAQEGTKKENSITALRQLFVIFCAFSWPNKSGKNEMNA